MFDEHELKEHRPASAGELATRGFGDLKTNEDRAIFWLPTRSQRQSSQVQWDDRALNANPHQGLDLTTASRVAMSSRRRVDASPAVRGPAPAQQFSLTLPCEGLVLIGW